MAFDARPRQSTLSTAVRISVPVHGNVPLKIGLQRHLMKLADIDEAEL